MKKQRKESEKPKKLEKNETVEPAETADNFIEPTSDNHPDGQFAYADIYVNEIGRAAMLATQPNFPVGSIIVREKFRQMLDVRPELLTVMIKREPGFNAKNGDWEYLQINGEGTQVVTRETVGKCQACHEKGRNNDFVFRTYLPKPEQARRK